jgi:regulatory protein
MTPQVTMSSPHPSISEPSREELARAFCLRLLTARARTRAELAGQLKKRGYADEIRDRVLDRLAAAGLVDDTDFAQDWVRSRRASTGKSRRALTAELQTRGVDNDVITSVLGGLDAGAERDRAEQLVRAKLRRETLGGDSKDEVRVGRRLVAMLARRGYSQTLAGEVVLAELAAERERRRV